MPSVTSRNKNSVKGAKNYAEADIKDFWFCPILIDFFTLSDWYFPGLYIYWKMKKTLSENTEILTVALWNLSRAKRKSSNSAGTNEMKKKLIESTSCLSWIYQYKIWERYTWQAVKLFARANNKRLINEKKISFT